MATLPLSGSSVKFYEGIPWQNDYESTRWFKKKSDQRAYFDKLEPVHTMKHVKTIRENDGHRIGIDKSLDELRTINYVEFENDGKETKTFYAFITGLEYESKNTTWATIEIDVLQTWMFDFDFQPSYIVREHQKLWDDDGNPVRYTQDEGLDYGHAYDNVAIDHVIVSDYKWLVIISKEKLHKGDVVATDIGVPQPLSYYLVPFAGFDSSVTFGSDADAISSPKKVLTDLYDMKEAQENIVSIYLTENIGIDFSVKDSDPDAPERIEFPSTVDAEVVTPGAEASMIYVESAGSFEATERTVTKDKYKAFNDTTEPRLMFYPYAVTVIDDLKGNRMEVKHEDINGYDITLYMRGSIGTNNKISWAVKNYNKHDDAEGYDDAKVANETSIMNEDPTDIPIIHDMLSAYIQGNKNSIRHQQNSSLMQAGLSATSGLAQAAAPGGIGKMMGAQTGVSGIMNAYDQIAGEQAKQQDIDNQPPALDKMGKNIAYDYGNGYEGIWVFQKQVKEDVKWRLEDFFHMFGYKSNVVKKPGTFTRKHFNYVQTKHCRLKGKLPQEDAVTIKAIFDKGVTLWHINDVGNYDKKNEVK